MSADKNEKNEYEFIKEEVIPKKRKSEENILPLVMTIFMRCCSVWLPRHICYKRACFL